MQRSVPRWLVVLAGALLACCGCLVACLGLGAYGGYRLVREQATFLLPERIPEDIPELHLPPSAEDEAALAQALAADLPVRDLGDLARRLKDVPPEALAPARPEPGERSLGDREVFWVVDHSRPENPRFFQAEAELRHISRHAYFWVQTGLRRAPDAAQLQRQGMAFDAIYETNRRYFGSEWSPGIDGETRVHIFNGRVPGVGGYFSSVDEVPKAVHPQSNEKEIFYVNLDTLTPGTDLYSAVLAHEFQHMIQWHQNRGEDGWVEEGLSELAMTLNGYPTDGSEVVFDLFPDTQLNAWTDEMGRSPVHYGASYLFAAYFYERFGEEALRALAADPRTGIAGFNAVLSPLDLDFDTLFRQWVVANIVPREEQRRLPFGSPSYARRHGTVRLGRRIARYPARGEGTVHQYGTDYLLLAPPKGGPVDLTVQFDGSSRTRLVPAFPAEGRAFWYSGRGNQRDITLTRAVDLRGVSQATLTFRTWYQIEDGWDFGYVAISTDGGETWALLRGAHMSDKNPMGNNYGWGYTGVSGGRKGDEPRWVDERIDLTPYAGREVLLRFEYVTDDAYHAVGWALDDIAIPEIGFHEGAEAEDPAWEARGFVRCTNFVPQRFGVQLVEWAGGEIHIREMPLDAENRGSLNLLGLGREVIQAVLAISALTPITTEWGYYTYRVEPLGGSAAVESQALDLWWPVQAEGLAFGR
ncbi:MAG: hypothetical protein ACUVS5_02040 [Anaerolineae bacterium]